MCLSIHYLSEHEYFRFSKEIQQFEQIDLS